MRIIVVMVTFAAALTAVSAYAADTSVPGASVSTPGSENKGNPIVSPDQGTAGVDTSTIGQNQPGEQQTVPAGTIGTPGSDNKGNPIPPPQ
jgi:hypothetical protein